MDIWTEMTSCSTGVCVTSPQLSILDTTIVGIVNSQVLSCAQLGFSAERAPMGGGRFCPPPSPNSRISDRSVVGEVAIESSRRVLTLLFYVTSYLRVLVRSFEIFVKWWQVRSKVNTVTSIGYRDGTNDSCEPRVCQNACN